MYLRFKKYSFIIHPRFKQIPLRVFENADAPVTLPTDFPFFTVMRTTTGPEHVGAPADTSQDWIWDLFYSLSFIL